VAIDPSGKRHEQHPQVVEIGSHFRILLCPTTYCMPSYSSAEYSDLTGVVDRIAQPGGNVTGLLLRAFATGADVMLQNLTIDETLPGANRPGDGVRQVGARGRRDRQQDLFPFVESRRHLRLQGLEDTFENRALMVLTTFAPPARMSTIPTCRLQGTASGGLDWRPDPVNRFRRAGELTTEHGWVSGVDGHFWACVSFSRWGSRASRSSCHRRSSRRIRHRR
jgi:hypothetical protein